MVVDIFVHGLGSGGDGIARLEDGRVVFIPGALPGDLVRVELAKVRKKIQYGKINKVLRSSAQRVTSRCPVVACGGCVLREFSHQGEIAFKEQRVHDTLQRIGGIDSQSYSSDFFTSAEEWRYRHRVRLHTRWSGRSWNLGFYEKGSHNLVNYSGCSVLWPELEKAVSKLAEGIHQLPYQARIKEIRLAYSRKDKRSAASFEVDGAIEVFRKDLSWLNVSMLGGAEVVNKTQRFRFGNLELNYDHKHRDEFDLRFEPELFTQANPEVNDALIESVLGAIMPQRGLSILELHSGIGNFSIPLARAGASVVCYEAHRRASMLAVRNARLAGVDITNHALADTEVLGDTNHFDVLLLDPPRSGAKLVCESLFRSPTNISRVVYVSCDVATLARDIKALANYGFKLLSVTCFDMFPQTQHVEVMAVLIR